MYAFAVLDATTYNINVFDPWADISLNGYSNFVAMKSKNRNLKAMISLGGWNDSNDGTGKYSKLVASSTNIAAFVNYATAFLAKYSFDGLDIDWEYPLTAADQAGYSNLITALRTAFNTKGYLLSAAVSCNPSTINTGNQANRNIAV
jgi:chitinase